VIDLVVLGSTGSIGVSTLEVVRFHPGRWRVLGLAAGRNVARLAEQVGEFRPEIVVTADAESAAALEQLLRGGAGPGEAQPLPVIRHGTDGLVELARMAKLVVNGLVGATGLRPTLAAVDAGARLALANKESMVLAGDLVMRRARESGAEIIPVDSEHSGVFQCLAGGRIGDVERLTLTASGGPLRRHPDWRRATPAEVLAHPVWAMGPRITTDSATMLNKGLEIIEAHWLFELDYDRIGVLIHPQAVVHALIEWRDGSVIAQLSTPDMKLPIQVALSWPERLPAPLDRLQLGAIGQLEFEEAPIERYPCLALALEAGRDGGLAPVVLNAADEVAVELFHSGQIQLGDLPGLVRRVLEAHPRGHAGCIEEIEEADRWARSEARRAAVEV
jgi:1-deoxy-D-xylulose-5-phosphate reductoisomerase